MHLEHVDPKWGHAEGRKEGSLPILSCLLAQNPHPVKPQSGLESSSARFCLYIPTSSLNNIPTWVSQMPWWLLRGTSFSRAVTFTHQTSSAIPQAPTQPFGPSGQRQPCFLSPSQSPWVRALQYAKHYLSHTWYSFSCFILGRQRGRRQIRERSLFGGWSCHKGQRLPDSGSQTQRCITVTFRFVTTDFSDPPTYWFSRSVMGP